VATANPMRFDKVRVPQEFGIRRNRFSHDLRGILGWQGKTEKSKFFRP
jgi:hypothetical protein